MNRLRRKFRWRKYEKAYVRMVVAIREHGNDAVAQAWGEFVATLAPILDDWRKGA